MTKAPIAAAFLLSTAIFTPINWAQTTQGQINGRVTDTSGAMIPGAEVEVVNPSTGVSQQISANEVGQYVIYVPFGTYDVRVSSLGFGTKLTTGVLVTTASETTVDVELDVETVAEQVSVSAALAQLETSDTTIGAAIEENLMRHAPIPVQGQKRRPYQYISLSPGVNNTNGRGNVAGSRTLNTVIMLDGLSTETTNNGVGEQAVGTEPSVEAIGEYKLLLSNMSAEYGRSSGGVITYATKSGTNDLHGSVWNFHNNSFLNARPWQAAERANSRNNEFGIAGGGPVVIPKVY
ncbi:MAG: carboxypeptidase regulatory-like domain-containing protein, partial [Bryobacterales bacterium]|nr:carboxypeptidase regulatory-like domain-containing protein [Bryobacterales bacterium]